MIYIVLITIAVVLIIYRLMVVVINLSKQTKDVKRSLEDIGVQFYLRAKAFDRIIDIAESYVDPDQIRHLRKAMAGCTRIDEDSTSEDILRQERIAAQMKEAFALIGRRNPDLRSNSGYSEAMAVIDSCERKIRTSSQIYNYNVARLNRDSSRMAGRVFAGMMGIHRRGYLGGESAAIKGKMEPAFR